jgi:hypothetical protein
MESKTQKDSANELITYALYIKGLMGFENEEPNELYTRVGGSGILPLLAQFLFDDILARKLADHRFWQRFIAEFDTLGNFHR